MILLLDQIAQSLRISPAQLEHDSLEVYMMRELRVIEAELFHLAQRHGVSSVQEMDAVLTQGALKEEDILDDYIELDYLETKREELKRALAQIQ
jgi:hypothetical protein